MTLSFRAQCGTSIGYSDEGLTDELYLTIGFFDHPERFEPSAHAQWRMRLPYLKARPMDKFSDISPL